MSFGGRQREEILHRGGGGWEGGVGGGIPQGCIWAVQAGLLTPLTFARHRLSPLAAFTSGAYFLRDLLVSQNKRRKDAFFFHPPSPFPGNFCNCNSGVICTAFQFKV